MFRCDGYIKININGHLLELFAADLRFFADFADIKG